MTEPKTDHFAEAESYLQKLDTLDTAEAYVAVVAAQAHATLAQGVAAAQMVDLQRELLASMQPPAVERPASAADAIEEQVKPAIDEPMEFGSIVRARFPYQPAGSEYLLWQKTPMHGKHYWESETGAVEVWSELTDVEVLRVGVGERQDVAPEETEDYKAGVTDTAYDLRRKLSDLRSQAITSERKSAYDTAIDLVEELVS